MGKRLFFALSIFLIIIVAFTTFLFFDQYIKDTDEYEILIIFVFLTLLTCALIANLILDFFIGHKEYTFEKDKIIVSRKENVLYTIPRNDISDVEFLFDSVNKASVILSFVSNDKKHRFLIKKSHNKTVEIFLRGIAFTKRESTVEYILQLILYVFSI